MKHLLSLAFVALFAIGAKAQPTLEITNAAACTLMVQTYSVGIGTCVYGNYQNNLMAPGAAISINAPAGEEWIYAEITSWPYCSGGVAMAVGTPMNCSSTCSWGAPSNPSQTNNGCNGCAPVVSARWDDPCGHPGVLVVY